MNGISKKTRESILKITVGPNQDYSAPHIAPSRETKKRSGGGDARTDKNNQKETGGIAC